MSRITIVDLLAEVGADKLRYQPLGASLDGEQRTRKDGTTALKFRSEENLSDIMRNRREAIVIWTDGGEFEAARQRLIAKHGPAPRTPDNASLENAQGSAVSDKEKKE